MSGGDLVCTKCMERLDWCKCRGKKRQRDQPSFDNGANRTTAQIHAGNCYQSYMRGWGDGAKAAPKRAEYVEQRAPGETLRVAYEKGYDDGIASRGAAQQNASLMYGYEPTILRGQS